jgi:hypothetical protein
MADQPQSIHQIVQISFVGLFVILYMVWMNLSGRVKVLEEKHKTTTDVLEGMCHDCGGNPYANTAFRNGGGYIASDSIIGSQPGSNGFSDERAGKKSSGFFGGGEAPVFYDIGDVRAARSTRGWSTGYATDADGNPIYDAAGNPVMASKASDYKSMQRRKALYGGPNMKNNMDMTDMRMQDAGYFKNAAGNWQIKAEGMWTPASSEGMWSPADSESFKSDEDLMYS